MGSALNLLQLLWSCCVLLLLPVIFECCLLGVRAIKSLQECKWVNVELSRCQRWCLSRKRITVLVLVQIATFRKGEDATPRLVAHLPRRGDDHIGMSPCNWNTSHYSITIYPLWNLPKMTFCMMLLTVHFDCESSIIMIWFNFGCCLHQPKLYSVYLMLRQSI